MPNKNSPNKNNITEKAIAKYQIAINKNISESEVQWNRYNAILVFNSILLTAIGLSYQNNINLPGLIVIFFPVAGLINCCLWYSMTSRGFQWIENWISFARNIEKKYLKDVDLTLNPVLNGNDYRKKDKSWLKTEAVAKILILIIAILYFIFLFYSLKMIFFNKMLKHNQQKIHREYRNNDWMIKDQRFR